MAIPRCFRIQSGSFDHFAFILLLIHYVTLILPLSLKVISKVFGGIDIGRMVRIVHVQTFVIASTPHMLQLFNHTIFDFAMTHLMTCRALCRFACIGNVARSTHCLGHIVDGGVHRFPFSTCRALSSTVTVIT